MTAACLLMTLAACNPVNGGPKDREALDRQAMLLTDVAVARNQLETKKRRLALIEADLETARTGFSSIAPQPVDFDALRRAATETADAKNSDGAAAPEIVDESSLANIVDLYQAQRNQLYEVLNRLAPNPAAGDDVGSGGDLAAILSEIYFALDSVLSSASPRSEQSCLGYRPGRAANLQTPSARQRKAACLQLLTELENGWMKSAAARLAAECTARTARLAQVAKTVQDDIERKAHQEAAIIGGLRAATSVDTLVMWGFPAMAGVVALLFLILRWFAEDVQKAILNTRVLVDVVIVLVLVTAILILGLSGKIESEVLGTLIGGITGYTLGRAALGDVAHRGRRGEGSAGVVQPPRSGDVLAAPSTPARPPDVTE